MDAQMWLWWDAPIKSMKKSNPQSDIQTTLRDFSIISESLYKDKKIPNPFEIQAFLYVPIIVVNGNIYGISLDSSEKRPLFDRQRIIPGFGKRISLRTIGEASMRSYIHIWNAIACQMAQHSFFQENEGVGRKLLINLTSPDLMAITL